jgi:hypothetical protein
MLQFLERYRTVSLVSVRCVVMRLLPLKASWVFAAAAAVFAIAPNAYAGGHGGFGAVWIPHGPMRPMSHPNSGPNGRFDANSQSNGRWDHPQNGGNDNGRFPCGGGGGRGHGGGCWNNGYAGVGGAYGLVTAAPAENGGTYYYDTVVYEAAAYVPPPDPTSACWVQKLTYDYDGSFVGTRRINACKIGPKVIDMSAVR